MSRNDLQHGFNKKQKINNHSSAREDAVGQSKQDQHKIMDLNPKRNESMIVCLDMCYFCFDVLVSHLNQFEDPVPRFSNKH